MLHPSFAHVIQRPHHKGNSVQENTSSHRSLRICTNNCEKEEVTMVRTCDQIKWPPQKDRRQKKRWEDNIREWTGFDFNISQRAAEDRQSWQKIVADPDGSGTQVTGCVIRC